MIRLFVFVFGSCFLVNVHSAPEDHFVTTWKTDNPGTSSSTSITVPMVGGPYNVDWDNDLVFDEFGLFGSVPHDFESPGEYKIRIHGSYDSIRFNFSSLGSTELQDAHMRERSCKCHTHLTKPKPCLKQLPVVCMYQ